MEVENIREGLKMALSRGETLEKAMQSFYNAGYKKEDIQEAAKDLRNSNDNLKGLLQNSKTPAQSQKNLVQSKNKEQIISSYGEVKENPKKTLIIASILILLFLAAIVFVLFKKEAIVIFINNLIGKNA